MRLLDLADGFNSNTTPIISALTASKLVQYISDGAYVTANGSPSGGEIYFNSVSGLVRVYDSSTSSWKTIGQSVRGEQEQLTGTVNGINTVFTVSMAPLNDTALVVLLDGVVETPDKYSYSSGTVTFNTAPSTGQKVWAFYLTEGVLASPSLALTGQFPEYRVLTSGEISAKKIVLANTPAEPSKVLLDWVTVSSQIYGVDFSVSGNELSWAGLGLDGFLTAGDTLRVFYLIF